SRNWILRRLIIDSIKRDPGNAQFATVFYQFATNGGNQALYKAAPTREKADALLDARLKAPFTADPIDSLYQWDSSRDYNPARDARPAVLTTAAHAALPDEIQVYTDDLEEVGSRGIELHVNATPDGRRTPEYPGEVVPHRGLRVTPEISWGLAENWDGGVYLPFVRSGDGAYFFAGPRL